MNGQFDLVVSETRSAALRVLSLIGRCQDPTDRKISCSAGDFQELAKNGEGLRRQRRSVMGARRKRNRHVRRHKNSKLKISLFRYIFVPDAHRNLD